MADEQSFDDFVRERSTALLRTGLLLTGDRHLAHDLVQSALVRVWPHWDRVATGRPEAYVRTTMVRLQASWWQRKWRGEIPMDLLPQTASPVDRMHVVDDQDVLRRALARLPLLQRQVVVLRHVEDLSVEDVASALGCPPGTVKSAASRGLATLRRELEDAAAAERSAHER